MKNTIYIYLDTEQEETIRIGKPDENPPKTREELTETMVADISTLCEALVVIIKAGKKSGILDEEIAFENCMKHLNDGKNDQNNKYSLSPNILKK